MKVVSRTLAGVVVVVLLTAAASQVPDVDQHFTASGALTASDVGVTPKTIKIGYVTPQTGVAGSTFEGGDQGALARINLQNAQGGIDGRKIQLVARDDGTGNTKTQLQDLVENEKVFGVIGISPFLSADAAAYLHQQSVPVTGFALSPDWGEQPNTNMFSWSSPQSAPVDGNYYSWDGTAKYMKSLGITKLATLAFGISPASVLSIKSLEASVKKVGIKLCYENFSISFGQTSFPTEALAIKQAGCDGLAASMVDASDVGLNAALAQGGVAAKAFYYTGYDQSVLDDTNASAALDGAYFSAQTNFTDPKPATEEMIAAIKKYAPSPPKGIPSVGVYGSYYAADLMIRGLELAGQNPTRADFISQLRLQTDYSGNGILPAPTSFAGFGTVAMFPAQVCSDYMQLTNGKFKTAKRNVCGKRFAYTK